MAKAQSLWSRLEGPVRADGQIVPETFEAELPRLVEALKKRGLALEIVTSDILAVTPRAEKVRRTAAMLGIRRFRVRGSLQRFRFAFFPPGALTNPTGKVC